MRKFFVTLFTLLMAASVLGANAHAGGYDYGKHFGPRAVTLWWVIFNNPDACTANPGAPEQCGAVDIFGAPYLDSVANGSPDPSLIAPNHASGVAVIYATGAKTNYWGKVRLTASIYRSEAGGGLDLSGPNSVDPLGLGRAFENTDAEVHLVVRDHGHRVRGGLLTQITNFLEPYCSDPNLLYFSGDNLCADVQFAVFAPGESGKDDVFAFGNPPSKQRRSSAHLFRQGDMLQAVIETRIRSAND